MPINKETIVSVFDEKLTLMQWLKTINKALDEAVLTGVEVRQKGNATYTFVVTFEDGTELESNEFVLAQGESINGAIIRNGHLYLSLTNGDELDAGNLKPVTSFTIDASQHLIVNYGDGTSQDLGAIFNGNITIHGDLEVTGDAIIPNVDAGYVYSEGAISGAEIVERMSGYSKKNVNAIVNDLVYTSICKNGNKLTIVFFGTITPLAQTNYNLIQYEIPSEVGAKLYPFTSGSVTNLLDVKYASLFVDSTDITQAIMRVRKESNTTLTLELRAQPLTPNTQYYCRFEVTFLLSDSL